MSIVFISIITVKALNLETLDLMFVVSVSLHLMLIMHESMENSFSGFINEKINTGPTSEVIDK